MPLGPPGRSCVSGATAIPVKLCPLPTILTVPPRSRAATTSRTTAAVSAGAVARAGLADSVRAQLCQVVGAVVVGAVAMDPPRAVLAAEG